MGITGSYTSEVYELPLRKPIQSNVSELTDLARLEHEKLAITFPEGTPKLKVYGKHFFLEWAGSSKDVILEPTENELIAKFTVKNTSWYRNFVQLHKAKGGTAFKVYSVVFAISIGFLLVSGFMMAWQTPKLRRFTLITSLIGFCSFVAFVYLS